MVSKNGSILSFFASQPPVKKPTTVDNDHSLQNGMEGQTVTHRIQSSPLPINSNALPGFVRPSSPGREFSSSNREISRTEMSNMEETTRGRFLGTTNSSTPPKMEFSTSDQSMASSALSRDLIIQDSDSEDSESSLEDLADILHRNTTQSSHTPKSGPENTGPLRRDTRRQASNIVSPPRPLPKYRYDLKSLAKEKEKDEATEKNIINVSQLIKQNAELSNDVLSHDQLLESVITGQDGTDADKLMKAVQRTEATKATQQWFFFDSEHERHEFPLQKTIGFPALGTSSSIMLLRDPKSREQAVLSGFIKDIVVAGYALPDDVVLWILQQAYTSPTQELRQAFGDLVLASPNQAHRLITPEMIDNIFRTLGATQEAMDLQAKVKLVSSTPPGYNELDWVLLRDVIDFLGQLSIHGSNETRSRCFMIFFRIFADSHVVERPQTLISVQSSLSHAARAFTERAWSTCARDTCSSILDTFDHAVVRLQILRCVPVTCLRLHELRQRMAIAFLFEGDVYSKHTSCFDERFKSFTKLLEGAQFHVGESTDYATLSALISFLDIAIDNGNYVYSGLADPDAALEFDKDVDALCSRVRAIHNSIYDAGAKYLSRIDAKEILEVVQNRLLYTVRTRPKLRQSVFDNDAQSLKREVIQTRKQSALLARFLQQKPGLGSDSQLEADKADVADS